MLHPSREKRTRLVVIVGPTAVGKTSLAIRLAEAIGGEVVSADSRQIYRGMDIGTAKASLTERARVRHHLLDVVTPSETLSLAQYQSLAERAILDIVERGESPLLVGGTGLYVWALIEGWQIPAVPPQPALRRQLEIEAAAQGEEWLHRWLRCLDPKAASGIDPRNVRRVIRALEVCLWTGRRVSDQRSKGGEPYRTLVIGLTMEREELYRRVDARIDDMLARGLLIEVKALLDQGYSPNLPALTGVGYRQIAAHLSGKRTIVDAVREIRRVTRRFIRHQSNWFRLDDSRVNWYDVAANPYNEIESLVLDFLGSGK